MWLHKMVCSSERQPSDIADSEPRSATRSTVSTKIAAIVRMARYKRIGSSMTALAGNIFVAKPIHLEADQ